MSHIFKILQQFEALERSFLTLNLQIIFDYET